MPNNRILHANNYYGMSFSHILSYLMGSTFTDMSMSGCALVSALTKVFQALKNFPLRGICCVEWLACMAYRLTGQQVALNVTGVGKPLICMEFF